MPTNNQATKKSFIIKQKGVDKKAEPRNTPSPGNVMKGQTYEQKWNYQEPHTKKGLTMSQCAVKYPDLYFKKGEVCSKCNQHFKRLMSKAKHCEGKDPLTGLSMCERNVQDGGARLRKINKQTTTGSKKKQTDVKAVALLKRAFIQIVNEEWDYSQEGRNKRLNVLLIENPDTYIKHYKKRHIIREAYYDCEEEPETWTTYEAEPGDISEVSYEEIHVNDTITEAYSENGNPFPPIYEEQEADPW